MDIHKPKAAHSWREFAIEIGTIVCGIVIALLLEQAVESFHWRHEVEAERESLLAEAKDNVTTAAYRAAADTCVRQRLRDIEEGFLRHAKGQPLGFVRSVARPPNWIATTSSWDIAVTGQALLHMPREERLKFSDAFDTYRAFAAIRREEDGIWRRLTLLDHPDILEAGDWVALHMAFGEALSMNERIATLTQYMRGAAALGQKPALFEGVDAQRLQAFCTPLF